MAFVESSKDRQKAQIDKAIGVVKGQLEKYQGAAETARLHHAQAAPDRPRLLHDTATATTASSRRPRCRRAGRAKPVRSAILGFAVGLFAGIGLAFLLEQFDTRIRQPEEIAALLRQPILGRIPKICGKLLHESCRSR